MSIMLERGIWFLIESFGIAVSLRLMDPVLDYGETIVKGAAAWIF